MGGGDFYSGKKQLRRIEKVQSVLKQVSSKEAINHEGCRGHTSLFSQTVDEVVGVRHRIYEARYTNNDQ